MKINTSPKIPFNLNTSARKLITGMGKGDALSAVILLEGFVTGGRTYQAYQRGGFVEARERATEETLGAIFWLGGVQAFNKLGDMVGKKLFNVKKMEFDVGKDPLRNPFLNYLKQNPRLGSKQLAAFKFAKIASSILLSNAVIGFVVPKLNQGITKKYQKGLEELDVQAKQKTTSTIGNDKNSQKTAFKGIGNLQGLLSITHNFENDARYKLLSSDAGIAGGRAVNARNKYERRESLFRDLSSIYFYMFCKNHIASLFNIAQGGKAQRLDPTSSDILSNHLCDNLGEKPYTAEEFEKVVLGNKNAVIPEKIQDKIKNGIIELNEFKSTEKNEIINALATKMSELQPQIDGKSILSTEQVKDIYTGGLINNPEILNEVFKKYSGGKSIDPTAYYPEKDLRKIKQQMTDFVQGLINKAKNVGENIDIKAVRKANKMNFILNAINLTAGFAVSAYFLSTVIPKVQYWMTQKQTGENKFPGIQTYKDGNDLL